MSSDVVKFILRKAAILALHVNLRQNTSFPGQLHGRKAHDFL